MRPSEQHHTIPFPSQGLLSAVALCSVLASLAPRPATAESPDTTTTRPAMMSRRDLWYGAAAVGGVLLASIADRQVWEAQRNVAGSVRLADAAQPLGTPEVLGPAVLLGYAAGRFLGHPGLEHASLRVGAAIAAAGVTTTALKFVAGRKRPEQAPGDVDEFRMFSGDDSFPSGHTTLAFAAATALDRETTSPWVPYVAYPVAGLVGWSRVHDEKHWISDVMGGAAVGFWVARKVENVMHRSSPDAARVGAFVSTRGGVPCLAARVTF